MLKIISLALLAITPLSGCTTMGDPAAVAAQEDNQCVAYGFKPGTDPFASCMLELDQTTRANDAAAWEDFRDRMHRVGAVLAAQQSRTTTCSTTVNGNVMGNYYNQTGTTTCQ